MESFPQIRYHRNGKEVVVRTPEQFEAMGDAWFPFPVAQLSEEAYAKLGAKPEPQKPAQEDPAPEIQTAPRLRLRLCEFCGEAGHTRGNCPAYKEKCL